MRLWYRQEFAHRELWRNAAEFESAWKQTLGLKITKTGDGAARITIQLKNGNSYLRTRKGDGSEVFDAKDDRHLEYWIRRPVSVYLVIRQTDELSGQQVIRSMNVTRYLKARKNKKSRQIIFSGEKRDMETVWKARDEFFPPLRNRK